MSEPIVQVESERVTAALGQYAHSLGERQSLLENIGVAQMRSIYRTFEEQGSPAGSWPPLAPSTLRNVRSKATPGRKVLILTGRLRNSIQPSVQGDSVILGTNLIYARAQQLGTQGLGARARRVLRGAAHRAGTAAANAAGGKSKQGGNTLRRRATRAASGTDGIPPRKYLVFRPEDPARIQGQVSDFTQRAAADAGLETGGA